MKRLLIALFILFMVTVNYLIIIEYFQNYVSDYFDIEKLLTKKYRCIRYFEERDHDKFTDRQCEPYVYEYMLFKLEKSRYVYMHYAYNFISCGVFALIYCYL